MGRSVMDFAISLSFTSCRCNLYTILYWAAGNNSRQRLTQCRTVGDRAFGVAAAHGDCVEQSTTCHLLCSATSLNTFKKHLKTHLFQSSYSRWRFVSAVFNQLLRVLGVVAYGSLNRVLTLSLEKIQDFSRTSQDPVRNFPDLFEVQECLNIKKNTRYSQHSEYSPLQKL